MKRNSGTMFNETRAGSQLRGCITDTGSKGGKREAYFSLNILV